MSRGKGRRQLFKRAPAATSVFRSFQEDKVRTVDVRGMPLPTWPDGRWCIEVAGHLAESLSKGRSLFDRGGTLGTYMYELSHVLRFCHANKVDLHQLTDSHFILFMRGLSAGRKENGEPSRKTRTIVRIGRRTLGLLDWVGGRRGIDDYLSPDGPHIQAYQKSFTRIISGTKAVRVRYWHHSCFPEISEETARNPINESNIDLLRKAASTVSCSSFQKMRRLAILRFLEATGARRSEVVNLKVKDVENAKRMERPFIDLITVKRRGEPEVRRVPMSHAELDFLLEYIQNYRAPLVDRKLGGRDHDFVFVSMKTAEAITPNTVTLEVYILRRAAGIKQRAHPHLFRHRFFTMKVYRFIVAHKIRDAQHFFEFCMKFNQLKLEIMQETGLKSQDTMHRYVDWAFALMPLIREQQTVTVDVMRLAREGRAELAELKAERQVLTDLQYADRIEQALSRYVDEMSRADVISRQRSESSEMLASALGTPKR